MIYYSWYAWCPMLQSLSDRVRYTAFRGVQCWEPACPAANTFSFLLRASLEVQQSQGYNCHTYEVQYFWVQHVLRERIVIILEHTFIPYLELLSTALLLTYWRRAVIASSFGLLPLLSPTLCPNCHVRAFLCDSKGMVLGKRTEDSHNQQMNNRRRQANAESCNTLQIHQG